MLIKIVPCVIGSFARVVFSGQLNTEILGSRLSESLPDGSGIFDWIYCPAD